MACCVSYLQKAQTKENERVGLYRVTIFRSNNSEDRRSNQYHEIRHRTDGFARLWQCPGSKPGDAWFGRAET